MTRCVSALRYLSDDAEWSNSRGSEAHSDECCLAWASVRECPLTAEPHPVRLTISIAGAVGAARDKIAPLTVDEYIEAADPDRRDALRALRDVILHAAPQAHEEIRHKMPYYVYHGDLVAFAAQKNHFSVYVMGDKRLTEHGDALGKLNCGKGCIRFKKLEELPLDVLREIVRDTAAENARAAS